MNNQIIGIVGVFSLTLFLLGLRHFLLSFGRSNRNRHVNPAMPDRRDEPNTKAVEDDFWRQSTPDSEAGSHPADEATGTPRAPHKRPSLRVINGG